MTSEASVTGIAPLEPYVFRTRNLRESENRAHTREGAQERGFAGSIVGGAIVYGQMLRPLLERWGDAWLARGRIEVRFQAPAYDDDRIEATYDLGGENAGEPEVTGRAANDTGVRLIELHARLCARLPPPAPLAHLDPVDWEGERLEGTWDRMVLDRPFRTYRFRVTTDEQREYCAATGDGDLALYGVVAGGGPTTGVGDTRPPAHPGLVMAQGSRVVSNQFVMPFWIHAASTLQHRRTIRVDDDVELRCVPIEKWKRGESEWVRFYQLYLVGGEPAIEVWKTSVIKVAPRPRA